MKTILCGLLSWLAAAPGVAQTIEITRSGSHAAINGPERNFTGSVQVDQLFGAKEPSRVSGGTVTFAAGARSAWHTHPLGQILIVTAGTGRVQSWGEPVEEIREGDIVRIPPGVKHWHGAAPTTAMTHIAIQEAVDGVAVVWMEKVSDAQYGSPAIAHRGNAGAMQMREEMQRPTREDMRAVSPALEQYTQTRLLGDLWKRPDLSSRDEAW